ncbi:MAG: hypothetical protein D6832_04830 [Alphaproteobacteria bacterium]|nr:MAG: hypothetical protein D6832_04830 [Alphaproteobacteria bacterium]
MLGGAAAALAGCTRIPRYDGPAVTRVRVIKSERRLDLLHEGEVLRSYPIDLGFAPDGPKRFEGDGRTPEGSYVIDAKNPDSRYHLSLRISYPSPEDVARARAAGREPGGDIFIHGRGSILNALKGRDWTAGCIAVGNREIEEIYAMVPEGTPIDILP